MGKVEVLNVGEKGKGKGWVQGKDLGLGKREGFRVEGSVNSSRGDMVRGGEKVV